MSTSGHHPPPPLGYLRLTLVGCGADSGVPVLGHSKELNCACDEAIQHPNGFTARSTTSLLCTFSPSASAGKLFPVEELNSGTVSHGDFTSPTFNTLDGEMVRHVLIDCGKQFRDAYFNVMTNHNVRSVDALFITSDSLSYSIGGLDDLRDLQSMRSTSEGEWIVHHFIPTYLLPSSKKVFTDRFPYIRSNSMDLGECSETKEEHENLLDKEKKRLEEAKSKPWNNIGIRRSTALHLLTVPMAVPRQVYVEAFAQCDIPVFVVPLNGGEGGAEKSYGLVFGRGVAFNKNSVESHRAGSVVVYLPNAAAIPSITMAFLESLVKIDVLFVDCLLGPGKTSAHHLCLDQVLTLADHLHPHQVIPVGLSCDLSYEDGQKILKAHSLKSTDDSRADFIMAYDGLMMNIPL